MSSWTGRERMWWTWPSRSSATAASRNILVASLRLDRLRELFLTSDVVPMEGVAAILDSQLRFVARTRDPERQIGQSATPEFAALLQSTARGFGRYKTLEGDYVYTAWMPNGARVACVTRHSGRADGWGASSLASLDARGGPRGFWPQHGGRPWVERAPGWNDQPSSGLGGSPGYGRAARPGLVGH